MSGVLIVSGTDTGIGKTVVAASLAVILGAYYWKPVQAGLADGTDSDTARLLGVAEDKTLPEAYRLSLAASPHLAAEHDGVEIDLDAMALPVPRPLIVEGAGGVMVPLRRDPPALMVDLFARWQAPVVLVARTGLGTINHCLLSIEALRTRNVPVAGIIFVGPAHVENQRIIPELTGAANLGRLPELSPLTDTHLREAMMQAIDFATIRRAMGLLP